MISLERVWRWKLDPTHHHRLAIRWDPDIRDITGNEIKKIANNSNPNCHGHIPRQTVIRSREGGHGGKRKREINRRRGERNGERKNVREREKPLYNFWYRCIISRSSHRLLWSIFIPRVAWRLAIRVLSSTTSPSLTRIYGVPEK